MATPRSPAPDQLGNTSPFILQLAAYAIVRLIVFIFASRLLQHQAPSHQQPYSEYPEQLLERMIELSLYAEEKLKTR